MHRNPKKHSKHWRLSWFRYETFITFFKFRFSDTKRERHTIFTMLTLPSDHTTGGASRRANWTGLAQAQKSTRFAQVRISTNFFFFQKSPKILSPSLPSMTLFTSPVSLNIWGFYYDICDPIYPTPPLGQDMTQGQFLSGV